MGELELLAQELRRAEARLLRAWLWLWLWVLLLVATIIFAFVYMKNEVPFVGTWRALAWIFVLPAFADPVFYCVLAGMNFWIFCQMQWETIEHCMEQRNKAVFYLELAISFAQAEAERENGGE